MIIFNKPLKSKHDMICALNHEVKRREYNQERNDYSQTFENKSSAPPNPPGGLEVVVLVVVVVAVVDEETGAALVQPPKSSSAVTVVGGCGAALGAPQPAPMSLGVSVSGTFIMDDAAGSDGAGSGVFHALLSKGSMFDVNMLGGTAVVVDAATSGFGAGAEAGAGAGAGGGGGFDRLNADFNSSWGEANDGLGGDAAGAGAGGGDERPARSFAKDEGRLSGWAVGDAKFVNP